MTVDGRRLVVQRASEVVMTDHGDPSRWGPWRLVPEDWCLDHVEWVYEVPLLECRTAAMALDYIAQVNTKAWADAATVAGLVAALDDVLDLQASLCPCGRAKTLTADQVRRCVASAARWAPIHSSSMLGVP